MRNVSVHSVIIRLILDGIWPIVVKICHVFDGDQDLQMYVRNLGPFPAKIGSLKTSEFWRDFGQLHNLIVNITGMQQAIINQKTALQTTVTPVHAHTVS